MQAVMLIFRSYCWNPISMRSNYRIIALSIHDIYAECKLFNWAGQNKSLTLVIWTITEWQDHARYGFLHEMISAETDTVQKKEIQLEQDNACFKTKIAENERLQQLSILSPGKQYNRKQQNADLPGYEFALTQHDRGCELLCKVAQLSWLLLI